MTAQDRKVIYEAVHSYGSEEDRVDNRKSIGLYSTRENAEAAIERVKDKPGFRSRQDGFEIDEIRLDKDSWVDGFENAWPDGTWTSADED
ncbi:MAG: hypothetical protein M3N13_00240 [Candidatus Eremiobacteraeota bacterium]|nr:hypothetical protein [Candidatus Eremiobacteraeota bacterium]